MRVISHQRFWKNVDVQASSVTLLPQPRQPTRSALAVQAAAGSADGRTPKRTPRGLRPFHSNVNAASVERSTLTSTSALAMPDLVSTTSHLQGRFVIPPQEVQRILKETNSTVDEFLFSLIQPASLLARPPISNFHVGSVGLGGSGAVYVGVNVEFPRAHLNNSIHSEQFLLVNCLHHGESSICMLAVSAAPCGHCRQFYSEVAHAETIKFIFGRDLRPKSIDELLPLKFGPRDLIADEPFPLLLEPQANAVSYSHSSQQIMAGRLEDVVFQQAAAEALSEAQKCYSPYSKCPSGCALITTSGEVFSGGYIESAAYNPSLSPFQAAVVDAITHHLPNYQSIQEVVLAELDGANVTHADNIRSLLQSVAPAAHITTLSLQLGKEK